MLLIYWNKLSTKAKPYNTNIYFSVFHNVEIYMTSLSGNAPQYSINSEFAIFRLLKNKMPVFGHKPVDYVTHW